MTATRAITVGARWVSVIASIVLVVATGLTELYTFDFQGRERRYVVAMPGIVATSPERAIVEWWQSRMRLVRGALVCVISENADFDQARCIVRRRPPRPSSEGTLADSVRMPLLDDEELNGRRFDVPPYRQEWTWWPRYDTAYAPYERVVWIPLWMPLAAASAVAWAPLLGPARAVWRRRRGLCAGCAYDRSGLVPEAACPECGKSERSC